MTWFSLKRTLQSDIASSIEVLNPINQDVSRSNLYTPLRYSAVLLSIGKTTQICHQNIPLKKVNCNGTVTYISAIPLKLAKMWQLPLDELVDCLMSVLQHQTLPPLWSHLQKTDDGWLEFVISQGGIEQWQQHLNQWSQPAKASSSWSIQAAWLWQLQSGYELCCRWQTRCRQQEVSVPIKSNRPSSESFLIPNQSIQALIYCLLDICDNWENSAPNQLVQQARHLVMALETCIATAGLSSEVKVLSAWLEPTRVVLEQVLVGRLGYQLAKHL
ncbi:MAG: hypothetical protein ACFB14_17610 [Leptolyngbyaceae cyanobacterium]